MKLSGEKRARERKVANAKHGADEMCPVCGGTGSKIYTTSCGEFNSVRCPLCIGKGRISPEEMAMLLNMQKFSSPTQIAKQKYDKWDNRGYV